MKPEDLPVPTTRLGRREFLVASAAAGVTAAGTINFASLARAKTVPTAADGSFAYGVASGFPSTKGITLWTRVKGLERSSRIGMEVAKDADFKSVVASQPVIADAARDFTVHASVNGLKPATEYHYRFHTKHGGSRVGTFRTLPPADSNQTLRIGFYSCSSYEAGYYTALAGLAREKDLDFVFCLGDYIYEHHYYDGPAARKDRTGKNHDGDVQSLAEYRQKYRFYQSDPSLQDMHAAYPFISLWDDHEVEDNYAGHSADSKQTNPKLENSGYPRRVSAEREEILTHFHDAGVENLVVLSGDLHTFVAGNLTTTGESTGTPVGTELLGGSATSFGLPEEIGIPATTLDALRKANDPHIVFADFERHGYCVLTVDKTELTGEFRTTDTRKSRGAPSTIATFKVESGTPALHQV